MKAKTEIHRFVIDVKHVKGAWILAARGYRRLDAQALPFDCLRQAIASGKTYCLELLGDLGLPCQLVIHGMDGRIKSERTYPDETPKRKG